MSKLPQRIAQHNLVFCTLLVMGLSEPMFLARVLIGCLFYLGGVNNVIMWSYNVHLVHMKLSNVFGGPGIVPQAVSRIAFAVDLARFSKKAAKLDPDIVALWGRSGTRCSVWGADLGWDMF